ncbi:glycosyltransferase family 2 protein [Paenibacillus sp. GSMTC-2017]|uniref:glycosyltransferase family 2 protein n=1 Tax=Paenibacillus sp. GSMTC-2017 TaxID=2794350 RepID=UPI001E29F2D2|nr:glycosyltransferase family 2 protein [Paenibacillus sp. GSMTC-2017]
MPSVSICIVTYNSESEIANCLEAVCNQSHPIQAIIIVDNESKDSTLQTIESYDSRNVPLEIISNKKNNGFAGGQNQAIKATNSDYVLVLNPDVNLGTFYIEELVNALELNRKAGSATGQLVFALDPDVIDSTGLTMGITRQAKDRGTGDQISKWQVAGEVFGVSGAASLYSRRMIQDVSVNGEFFDEQFFAYKEDVDVAWRAQKLGWKSLYEPNAKALHARGWKKGNRKSIPVFIRQHSYMNYFYTLIKNEKLSTSSFYQLPLIAGKEMLKFGYLLFREPAVLNCLPTLLRTLPSMFKKRRIIENLIKEKQR